MRPLTAIARRCDDDKLLFSTGGQLEFTFIAVRDAVGAADFGVGQLNELIHQRREGEKKGIESIKVKRSARGCCDLVTNAL